MHITGHQWFAVNPQWSPWWRRLSIWQNWSRSLRKNEPRQGVCHGHCHPMQYIPSGLVQPKPKGKSEAVPWIAVKYDELVKWFPVHWWKQFKQFKPEIVVKNREAQCYLCLTIFQHSTCVEICWTFQILLVTSAYQLWWFVFWKLTRALSFVITIFRVWLPYSVLFSRVFSASNLERIETTFVGPVKMAHFSNTYELCTSSYCKSVLCKQKCNNITDHKW